MSTTHEAVVDSDPEKHLIKRLRRQPGPTSTSAKTARKAFGDSPIKLMSIPKVFDDYNHYMGAVDVADQLRSYNPGLRRIRRGGWHALLNFMLSVVLVNSFILSSYSN